ncbi:VCBS repeat-containing protein [bacterium]|nr:VCBS repeat-containing protein [bacterium]
MNKMNLLLLILLVTSCSKVFSVEIKKLVIKPSIRSGFNKLDNESTGVNFINKVKLSTAANNQIVLNGSGVTAGDYNKDGFCDIYFAGIEEENVLYENKGNFKFKNTTPIILKCTEYKSTAVVFADINNDTWLDILVGTINSGIKIFTNDKKGGFVELNNKSQIDSESAVFGLAVSDIQNDGDLDIYVSTYRNYSMRSNSNFRFETVFDSGKQKVKYAIDKKTGEKINGERFFINNNGKIFESGVKDYIFINNGAGVFEAKTVNNFIENPIEENTNYFNNFKNWGLGCIFADLNGDYLDDIFVCNDLKGGDYLFYNNGDSYSSANHLIKFNSPMFSMGVDVADINNDGYSDIFVVDMLNYELKSRKEQKLHHPDISVTDRKPFKHWENNRNMLYIGNESGAFNEIAYYSGLESSDWSWCPIFIDVDLDGFQDVIITNGFGYDLESSDLINSSSNKNTLNDSLRDNSNLTYLNESIYDPRFTKNDSNFAFRNNHDLTFTNKSKEWGFFFKGISQGACLADLDNDGDDDVIVNNFTLIEKNTYKSFSNKNEVIYENITPQPRVRFKLTLNDKNTHGVGSTICFIQDGIRQSKQIRSGSRYCSSDEAAVTFSYKLGSKTNLVNVVYSGFTYTFNDILPNRLYKFTELDLINEISHVITNKKLKRIKLFSKLENDLKIKHQPGFVDSSLFQSNINKELFINEPILSVSGISDNKQINEELVINSGRVPKISSAVDSEIIINNNEKGRIIDFFSFCYEKNVYLFELRSQNLIKNEQASYINLYIVNSDNSSLKFINSFNIPGSINCFNWGVSKGNTQNIDIILGGGHILGHYPVGDKTYIIPFSLEKLQLILAEKQVVYTNRAINDIILSDLDNDGVQELILAPEGDGIQVLSLINKNYTNISANFKLDHMVGNWNSLSSADINSDGLFDLVCGNWGSNNSIKKYQKLNYKLYFKRKGDTTDLYETYAMGEEDIFLKNLEEFKKIHPAYSLIYKSNAEFKDVSIQSLFQENINSINYTQFNTCILINKGNRFESMELDPQVNFLPTFGIDINDYNLDGRLDIFLCQGFYGAKGDTEPSYNNSGLFLFQDMNGYLEPVEGNILGISNNLYSLRTVTSPDINGDNRPDIIIGDYGKAYAIHTNISNDNGIKLNLQGNDNALVGLKARIRYLNGSLGPVYEYSPKQGFRSSKGRSFIFNNSRNIESILIDHRNKKHVIDIKENIDEYSVYF